ncbi:hypothetical protein DFP72DRAFT_1081672 [Ephemerocybe angulata]|uniref:Uncharacterized protein n=1 Tax=Ephemerocybe angulata TaxID=980116 RepID=A0A8H6LVU8_9AGAR|nr:hypothetical protein DFP72DRAFT_1081672 [Tulosesus angulatus]
MNWYGIAFSHEDAFKLGWDVFYDIMSTKFKVGELQKVMAYNTPVLMRGALCLEQLYSTLCKQRWENSWWNSLAHHILYPDWSSAREKLIEDLTINLGANEDTPTRPYGALRVLQSDLPGIETQGEDTRELGNVLPASEHPGTAVRDMIQSGLWSSPLDTDSSHLLCRHNGLAQRMLLHGAQQS